MAEQKDAVLQESAAFLFVRYVSTSSLGMLTIALYILADVMFIGRYVGSDGLAALNLVLPVFNLLFGSGLLLGIGGAAALSVSRGQQRWREAEQLFSHALLFGLMLAALFSVGFAVFLPQWLAVLGAGAVDEMSGVYLRIVGSFAWVFLLVQVLTPFVRSDDGPHFAMAASVGGGLLNIVLDYVFIVRFAQGMAGAAWATVISTSVGLAILVFHCLFRSVRLRWRWQGLRIDYLWRIIKNGGASFVLEVSSGLVIFLFNRALLVNLGSEGVAAYSVVANVSLMVVAVFLGIGQGIQPLVSVNFGAGQIRRMLTFQWLGLATAAVFGIFVWLAGTALRHPIMALFLPHNPTAAAVALQALPIYFVAFPLMGANLVMAASYQAQERSLFSMLLALSRGPLWVAIGLGLLPQVFGVVGIWWVVPLAEAATLFTGLVLFWHLRSEFIPILRRQWQKG